MMRLQDYLESNDLSPAILHDCLYPSRVHFLLKECHFIDISEAKILVGKKKEKREEDKDSFDNSNQNHVSLSVPFFVTNLTPNSLG